MIEMKKESKKDTTNQCNRGPCRQSKNILKKKENGQVVREKGETVREREIDRKIEAG